MSSGVIIGLHCSHEQHAPSVLLRHVQLATDAGFSAAMCSDHFHPWSERQGHSGFAWSWLGAALERTSLSFGTVCAPGQRYHPAIIAQAAATLAEMYPARLWMAIGSGEALNEAITGEPWPEKSARNARLQESAEVIRALWRGETVSRRGYTTTSAARLYSRPAHAPLLIGAALTPDTARWVGSWADGLITVAGPRPEMKRVVSAFREGGGEGKPMFLQVTLSLAPTDDESVGAAYAQWRHSALSSEQLANLTSPWEFDRLCDAAAVEEVLCHVRASADIARHLAWLHEDSALGFERIYLHNVAGEYQERFIDLCGRHVLPDLNQAPADAGAHRS
jgi:coenzyme F420-dependent glucose-6-phosphate dehydrogenase